MSSERTSNKISVDERAMSSERTANKISVDDLVETGLTGAIRALKARTEDLQKTGVYISYHLVCGIPAPVLTSQLGSISSSGNVAAVQNSGTTQ